MSLALDGDREAYGKLMTELGTAVERYVRRRFGPDSGSDFAEECVQESLLAVHRARHTWDPRRPFRPWFYTLVRHKAIDLLRRRRVQRSHVTLAPDEDRIDQASETSDPSARIDSAAVLEQLSPDHREALVLTKLHGLTLEEAADRVGVTTSAMKTRVHRAVRASQKILHREIPE